MEEAEVFTMENLSSGGYTAQFLIGSSHTYHGGIRPTHILFLWEDKEDSKYPVLCLKPIFNTCYYPEKGIPLEEAYFEKFWVCEHSTLLEDAMLMIGLFVLQNKELISLAEKHDKKLNSKSFVRFIYPYENRKIFYEKLKEISWECLKVSISVFFCSSLRRLFELKKYKDLEFEISITLFVKDFYSPFKDIQFFEFFDLTKNLEEFKTYKKAITETF